MACPLLWAIIINRLASKDECKIYVRNLSSARSRYFGGTEDEQRDNGRVGVAVDDEAEVK